MESPGDFPAVVEPSEPPGGIAAHQVFKVIIILLGIGKQILLPVTGVYQGEWFPEYDAEPPQFAIALDMSVNNRAPGL
jgi:hypothetical protein